MESIATSVRIAGDAIDILSALASKLGQSKAQVIEIALKELEERIFWAEVADAFDRIAADPRRPPSRRPKSNSGNPKSNSGNKVRRVTIKAKKGNRTRVNLLV